MKLLLRLILAGSLIPGSTLAASLESRLDTFYSQKAQWTTEARLDFLLKENWAYTMEQSPETATYNGYSGFNHLWSDLAPEALALRDQNLSLWKKAIQDLDRSQLPEARQLDYDLFLRNINRALEGIRFPSEYLVLDQLGGIHQDIAQVMSIMPATTVKDYEDIIARLSSAGRLADQTIYLLQQGLNLGVTPPRITLREVGQQIRNQLVANPDDHPALAPLKKFPPAISAADQARLRAAATNALVTALLPAFNKLHRFFEQEYYPRARESIAASDLPDGREWYAYNVKGYTTTDLSPREIHETGLREVQRIRGEMEKVMKAANFKGTLAEFLQFLRTDSQFFFSRPEDLVSAYRDIAKRADLQMPRIFGKLPRLSYGVEPVPSYAEKSQTTAYYMPGAASFGRAGVFYANTYDLKTRPRWEMEALTLHEAVPGHHHQIAIAQELEGLPEFRRHGGYTAFVEGWGLYSESLGEEMGFYKDPYSKFGQLTYEMWRAIRLVVDTGMHSLGWSRQKAIDFFKENAAKTEHDIVVEVDRYIIWPGQALAYKIGELKIKELRKRAEARLGPTFNLRSFHDELLGQGALPLEILEKRLDTWMERELAQRPKSH